MEPFTHLMDQKNRKKSKKGIKHLTPAVRESVANSKNAHWEWKIAGKPDEPHPLYMRKQATKRDFNKKDPTN